MEPSKERDENRSPQKRRKAGKKPSVEQLMKENQKLKSENDGLKSENDGLKKKNDKLQKKIKEKIACIELKASITETEIPRELTKYSEMGQKLAECKETKNIKNLIGILQDKNSGFFKGKQLADCLEIALANGEGPPFMFICTSSGTGKTQLPFSLDMPSLYFCLNVKKQSSISGLEIPIQPVYSHYENITECLMKCLDYDISLVDIFEPKIPGNDENPRIRGDILLLFPRLICLLCESIIKLKSENQVLLKESWVVTELRVSYKPAKDEVGMTIESARGKLQELFAGKALPVIFLDECQKTKSDGDFINRYLYIRRSLRQLGLVGIFMGTNANLANYVSKDAARFSRNSGEAPVNLPWCFIVHTLAPTLPALIKENEKKCLEIIVNNGNDKNMKSIVGHITKALVKERPLFVQIIFKALEDILTNNPRMKLNDLLDRLNSELIEAYTNRKYFEISGFEEKDIRKYNYNNLCLIHPEIYEKNSKNSGNVPQRDSDFEKSCGIHMHIAHLYIPEKVLKMMEKMGLNNCVGISIINNALAFTGTVKSHNPEKRHLSYGGIKFEGDQVFSSFSEEPFIQSAYIGKRNLELIFIGNRLDRISASDAIVETSKQFGLPLVDLKKEWRNFELMVSAAGLIASQCDGYSGCKFEKWLTYFIRDLKVGGCGTGLPIIESLSELSSIMNVCVPMCAPTIGANWNKNLIHLLEENKDNTVYTGVAKALVNEQKQDFLISDIEGENIIHGECKTSERGFVSKSKIEEAFKQLLEVKSPVKIAVVNKLDPSSLKKDITDANDTNNLNVYLLMKSKEDDTYRWEHIYKSGAGSPVVLLISVNLL